MRRLLPCWQELTPVLIAMLLVPVWLLQPDWRGVLVPAGVLLLGLQLLQLLEVRLWPARVPPAVPAAGAAGGTDGVAADMAGDAAPWLPALAQAAWGAACSGWMVLTPEGRLCGVSHFCADALDLGRDGLQGTSVFERLRPGHAALAELLRAPPVPGQCVVHDGMVWSSDALGMLCLDVTLTRPWPGRWLVLRLDDVTPCWRARMSLRLADTVFRSTRDGMALTDAEGWITDVNPALCRLLEVPKGQLLGRPLHEALGVVDRAGAVEAARAAQAGADARPLVVDLPLASGRQRTVHMWFADTRSVQGDRLGTVVSCLDPGERGAALARLEQMAWRDALTGLPNRACVMARLQGMVGPAGGAELSRAVLLIDLDRFKYVNDSMGHPVGDELLRGVAQRLLGCLGEGDVLGRWGGDEFVPIAEETGLILPLGEWILEQACAQMAAWREQGCAPDYVAVNLSSRQFEHAQLVEQIDRALVRHGLPASMLELEITEGHLLDPGIAVDRLNRLKQLGVRIAIDDFGTGYSSLSYIGRYPIDKLKIDRSFVCGLPAQEVSCAIVEAIVGLGRALRVEVLAEGVETAAQLDYLRRLGVTTAQGWLFARAAAPAEIGRMLQAQGSEAPMPAHGA